MPPGSSSAADAIVSEQIAQWRDTLINLTARNRLLNFRATKTSTVAFSGPPAVDVVRRLSNGARFSFHCPEPPDAESVPETPAVLQGLTSERIEGDYLECKDDRTTVAKALRTLQRRSQQEFMDKGLWILYLAVGTLHWVDVDGTELISPLVLIPVKLEASGPRQPLKLSLAPEDPLTNPALTLKMRDFDITLPEIEELDPDSIDRLLHDIEATFRRRPTWKVQFDIHLSYFSFHKEAMYRDLLENAETIAEHPLIRAFALGGSGLEPVGEVFEPIPDDLIDDQAPPETTPLVLDADSSQRACIEAARASNSFVIDGPPGTGKSQTIANIIAALLHAGRSVLFVSEKAAALEVVENRLREVGLSAYATELHSHKATRKEVATNLGWALAHQPIPPVPMPVNERVSLKKQRLKLSRYAHALNQIRAPLEFSLHQVLGHISTLVDAPSAPGPDLDPDTFTADDLAAIREATNRLARAWRPALQGSNYLWRDVVQSRPLDTQLTAAEDRLADLAEAMFPNRETAETLGFHRPSLAAPFERLLEAFSQRPEGTPLEWLQIPDVEPVENTINDLVDTLVRMQTSTSTIQALAGDTWPSLPAHPTTIQTIEDLAGTTPTTPDVANRTAAQCARLAATASERRQAVEQLIVESGRVAELTGVDAPTGFKQSRTLLDLTAACIGPYRPPGQWLSRQGLQAATDAAQALTFAHATLAECASNAAPYFTAAALQTDTVAMSSRFANIHRGVHKLGKSYRDDKRLLGEIAQPGVTRATAISELSRASAWRQAVDDLATAQRQHAPVLSDLYRGDDTDWQTLRETLNTTEFILTHVPEARLPRLHKVGARETATSDDLRAGHQLMSELFQSATSTPDDPELQSAVTTLNAATLVEAAEWWGAVAAAAAAAHVRVTELDEALGRTLTWGQSHEIITAADAGRQARNAWDESQERYADCFGPLFAGEATRPDSLTEALAWARSIRQHATPDDAGERCLTEEQVKGLCTARLVPACIPLAEAWSTASADVMECFAASRHAELAAELDDFSDGRDMLAALQADTSGQDEWFAHVRARADLHDHGLDRTVEFCITEAIPARDLPAVVDKAVLSRWADAIIERDDALADRRSSDRDAIVDSFRSLDEKLIQCAVADVINAVNERRPTSAAGQAKTIQREAAKQRRHMPVRKLLDATQDVVKAITPCFMMSPLAVSQYLPQRLRFDVVIFDEASQVTPADAVNSIYRADSVIIAGDQKQLPPTDFFTALSGDENDEWVEGESDAQDFKSVLDLAKSSGAIPSLTLKWHYRSRHEDLIAFSNSSFYGGDLITFPGALHESDHVGVEYYKVLGTYRRGSTSDNPTEAAFVAERVLHHFDHRPHMSLGVVAFSEAQATAIETAVAERRVQRPDLDDYFAEDRLGGFFIKNLESVQGDERDVMIFSIGYGPDENGKIWNNFGPLNRSGGWRRLNVAITRARHRNEIVSSISAADVAESANESVRHFRRYLDYAERGQSALALSDEGSLGGPESVFEESVIATIRSWGFEVTPQVGTAGYRVDIGVRHPEQRGIYMLGIECDGYMYHSSKTARDRDRLRQQVLEGLGWRLHRIWGTAWYRARALEEERLKSALEQAAQAPTAGLLTVPTRPRRFTDIETEAVELSELPDWTTPYETATVGRLPGWVDPSEPGNSYSMTDGVRKVVSVEQPVHISVLENRLRDAWGIGRIGSRIRANLELAISQANVVRRGDFLVQDVDPPQRVRTPTDEVRRTVTQVDDTEIESALLGLARDAGGISSEELILATARVFGWQRRGAEIQERLAFLVEGLLEDGSLIGNQDRLTYREPG